MQPTSSDASPVLSSQDLGFTPGKLRVEFCHGTKSSLNRVSISHILLSSFLASKMSHFSNPASTDLDTAFISKGTVPFA